MRGLLALGGALAWAYAAVLLALVAAVAAGAAHALPALGGGGERLAAAVGLTLITS